jgi:hypothetical protein
MRWKYAVTNKVIRKVGLYKNCNKKILSTTKDLQIKLRWKLLKITSEDRWEKIRILNASHKSIMNDDIKICLVHDICKLIRFLKAGTFYSLLLIYLLSINYWIYFFCRFDMANVNFDTIFCQSHSLNTQCTCIYFRILAIYSVRCSNILRE